MAYEKSLGDKAFDIGGAIFFGAVGLVFIVGAIAGAYALYQWRIATTTGPCAGKGGPSYQMSQDYLFCDNGERVDLKPSSGNTNTVRVRMENP